MLCTYFKGRTSFLEMMNMPLSYINALYDIAIKRSKTEEGKKNKEAENMEEMIEEAIT